jgi:hypothetical protein
MNPVKENIPDIGTKTHQTEAELSQSVTKRKHLVESAGYWFDHFRNNALSYQGRMAAAENAYNHVENALAAAWAAIRKHRDQRGDDRCWLDDRDLYTALPEGYTPPKEDSCVELERCKKFIASRHDPDTVYVSPQRRIDELLALLKESLTGCTQTEYRDWKARAEAAIENCA